MKKFILAILMSLSAGVLSFEYDAKNLPLDLRNSSDIVIAKKVSGRIAYGVLTEEIDEYQESPIDWRYSPAWKRLQERNKVESVFLVMNSIRGELEVGEEFKLDDGWIPVDLGSVNLFFLNRLKGHINSNPCLRIPVASNKQSIIKLSSDSESLIDFVLKNNLSFCSEPLRKN